MGLPRIAPFWADVDTRNTASGLVYHKIEPRRITIIWDHVGYYGSHADKLNTFELILTDATDPLVGIGRNACFSYDDMQWTTGDASSGSGGFGGFAATVGVDKGDGVNYIQIGRFDHPGTDYDGPFGINDGISYLDNKEYCFFVGPGIAGMKYNDLNVNGVFDAGEPGLAGWTINLIGPVNTSTTTDAAGNYFFSPLPPGAYTVSEQQQPGWIQTAPATGSYNIVLGANQFVSAVNFGNFNIGGGGRGTIKGTVFDDRNGNGMRDVGERGLSGWRVQASVPGAPATLTDENGEYAFNNILFRFVNVIYYYNELFIEALFLFNNEIFKFIYLFF